MEPPCPTPPSPSLTRSPTGTCFGLPYNLRMAENLRDGHKWLYEQGFDHFSENLPEEKVEHVLQILGIYGDMQDSYDQL